ncbi:unnamed protein product [Parnassius mnemosyne]|uniref:Uncharacterized protein n=1 Tax=Parnassius mnemosyne TaxID=213953 RepID=A0AAV1KS47_9NEOP
MSYHLYHCCIVPECKNTSIKTPEKLWIQVAIDLNMRNIWLNLAKSLSLYLYLLYYKSKLYFCEDHFDLENDMENYTQCKIMGYVKRIQINRINIGLPCYLFNKIRNNTAH